MPPNSKAHNVIMGRTWVDCYGDFSLLNASTGATCSLYFTPCGWFSYGRYEVRIYPEHVLGSQAYIYVFGSVVAYLACLGETG